MEYAVENIQHKLSGEVDVAGIEEALSRRSADGWRLHSVINDEGGKLQASLTGSEKTSLSGGPLIKEDRVVLIFVRSKGEK
jgi:hypothetical protein